MTASALAAEIDRQTDPGRDELARKVEALRRLSPVKVRLLAIIADSMIREAQERGMQPG